MAAEVRFANHLFCFDCYVGRQPAQMPIVWNGDGGVCCFCGHPTDAGIWYRADSGACVCPGNHDGD